MACGLRNHARAYSRMPHLKGVAVKQVRSRILIVDDDHDIRRSFCRMVEFMGYEAAEACSGEEALIALGREKYDLVLMDVVMPGIGGIEAARRIACAHEHQPVILMSGYFETQEDAAVLPRGVRKLLAKPIDEETLLNAVRNEISTAREALSGKK